MKYSREDLKTTLNIALPAMLESFFMSFTGLVDSYMVSSLGSNAVAAVGLTAQPKFVGLAIFLAMSVSVSALVARRFGEKKRTEANAIVSTSLLVILICSAIVSISFCFFSPQIMRLCGSTPETHDDAVTYFNIIMGGIIFNCIQIGINSALRGSGNTKITMRTNLTSNLVNIVFNYLLIGGKFGFPALGIRGAAIATVLGSAVACVMSVISIMNYESFISFPYILREKILPSLAALKSMIKIGYGIFFEQILLRLGFLATAIMAASQGNDAMAAHQVCMNIIGVSFSFGDGLQTAAVALIGRSLGEKNPDAAKRYGSTCQMLGGAISFAVAAVYFFGASAIMNLFFDEPNVINIGISIMRITIFIVLFQIRQVIHMGCLRAAGDTLYTAILSAVSVSVVRTVASYILGYSFGLGIFGIWLGILCDQLTRYIFASLRFRTGKWTQIQI